MSMRIAVALAATIGAGIVMSSAAQARSELVGINGDYAPGTIVVKTHERRLYLVLESGRAMRYPVGVGKAGKQWAGTTTIDGKYLHPAWSPPSEVKRDKPNMPDVIPGGSPRNPMGVAAMTLAGGEYAIPAVPPGAYELVVAAPGFLAAAKTGIRLSSGQASALEPLLSGEMPESRQLERQLLPQTMISPVSPRGGQAREG